MVIHDLYTLQSSHHSHLVSFHQLMWLNTHSKHSSPRGEWLLKCQFGSFNLSWAAWSWLHGSGVSQRFSQKFYSQKLEIPLSLPFPGYLFSVSSCYGRPELSSGSLNQLNCAGCPQANAIGNKKVTK